MGSSQAQDDGEKKKKISMSNSLIPKNSSNQLKRIKLIKKLQLTFEQSGA